MQTSRAWHPRPCPSRASSWEDGPHPLHHHGANRPRDGGRGGCRCRRTGRLTAAFPTAEDESPGPRGSQGATTSLQPHHGCQLALEAGAAVPGGVSWSLGPAPPAAAQAGDRPAWPPGTTASGFKAFASARRRRPSLPPDPVGPPPPYTDLGAPVSLWPWSHSRVRRAGFSQPRGRPRPSLPVTGGETGRCGKGRQPAERGHRPWAPGPRRPPLEKPLRLQESPAEATDAMASRLFSRVSAPAETGAARKGRALKNGWGHTCSLLLPPETSLK